MTFRGAISALLLSVHRGAIRALAGITSPTVPVCANFDSSAACYDLIYLVAAQLWLPYLRADGVATASASVVDESARCGASQIVVLMTH
mgnify:CR=1 FL=1